MSKEKLIFPKMENVDELVKQITVLEQSIKKAKESLQEAVGKVADGCKTDQEVTDAMKHIYWHYPDVQSKSICNVLGVSHPNMLYELIGGASAKISCDKCDDEMIFKTRTELQKVQKQVKENRSRNTEAYNILCPNCLVEIFNERIKNSVLIGEMKKNRLNELKKMPYGEYLQTPEWKQRRLKHLNSADYKCQLCNNSEKTLDVHHRTYDRKGDEKFIDLIVLCRACHKHHHFDEIIKEKK